MSNRAFFGASLLSLCAILWSCQAPTENTTTSVDRMSADLEFLASDERKGRLPGTPGYDAAADYVAKQFGDIGLASLPTLDGFCQPVILAKTTLSDRNSTITIGSTSFQADNAELLIQPPLRNSIDAISGEAVFVGYGVEAPSFGLTPFDGLDLSGKVVVYLNGFPPELPGLVGAHLSSLKPQDVLDRGAIATIEIETPASLERRPWTLIRDHFTKPLGTWVDESGEGVVALPRSMVRTTGSVTETLFAEGDGNLDDVFAAMEAGQDIPSFPLNQIVSLRREAQSFNVESCNVVGVLPGRDPDFSGEAVIFMAHLDHLGEIDGEIFNGAFDNAIGVAILLEIARRLEGLGDDGPKRTVIFAAVTAEESGLLGADYLSRSSDLANASDLVAAFNVDMPILTFPFEDVVLYGEGESNLGPVILAAASSAGIYVSPDPKPAEGFYVRSDHYSFVKQGVPSIYTKLGDRGPGAEARAEFVASHYHQPSDDLNVVIDWEAVERFTAFQAEMVLQTANMDERPDWIEGSVFATSQTQEGR